MPDEISVLSTSHLRGSEGHMPGKIERFRTTMGEILVTSSASSVTLHHPSTPPNSKLQVFKIKCNYTHGCRHACTYAHLLCVLSALSYWSTPPFPFSWLNLTNPLLSGMTIPFLGNSLKPLDWIKNPRRTHT